MKATNGHIMNQVIPGVSIPEVNIALTNKNRKLDMM
jgi:hypothetical protein